MTKELREASAASDCILFSTADWSTPYWTNKQHTAKFLTESGWRVLYVETVGLRAPNLANGRDIHRLVKRLVRGLKALILGPERISDKLWILPPLALPAMHHVVGVRALNQGLLRLMISRFLKQHQFERPLIWTYHPYVGETLKNIPTGDLIYHCVDDLAAVPGVDAITFNREEVDLLRTCKAVFTTAVALREKCLPHNPNTYFFPNVVDEIHFGRALAPGNVPSELAAIPEPRIVYHGVLSDFKVNADLLQDVFAARPDWNLVLIGDERAGQSYPALHRLRHLPNVHFIGYRPYEALPDYLRGMSVGLLPSILNDYTRSMFPMKFYEYLASGLPVVATPLDFTRAVHPFLAVGSDASEFSAAIADQLKRGKLNANEVKVAVGENTWTTRLKKMLDLVMEVRANSRF
ncbi:glycosyltransferase [Rhizobium sp. IMFF44]|uniref:glycosyltransferase n=1 Tax=Rhizobium sp. IMFF44 TaxID=3342350 RepID=UPI0035B8B907